MTTDERLLRGGTFLDPFLRFLILNLFGRKITSAAAGSGERLFGVIERMQLEGMVAKRKDSVYSGGRSRFWQKIKTSAGQTEPVLVVNGDDDRMVPTSNSLDLVRRLPNAQLKLYSDAGHGGIPVSRRVC